MKVKVLRPVMRGLSIYTGFICGPLLTVHTKNMENNMYLFTAKNRTLTVYEAFVENYIYKYVERFHLICNCVCVCMCV